jgi:hypothetical protein
MIQNRNNRIEWLLGQTTPTTIRPSIIASVIATAASITTTTHTLKQTQVVIIMYNLSIIILLIVNHIQVKYIFLQEKPNKLSLLYKNKPLSKESMAIIQTMYILLGPKKKIQSSLSLLLYSTLRIMSR